MFYIKQRCWRGAALAGGNPTCPGLLGFMTCDDGETIVLVCDECDTVWVSPEEIHPESMLHTIGPDSIIPGLNRSIDFRRGAYWSKRNEIVRKGWEHLIEGEGGWDVDLIKKK